MKYFRNIAVAVVCASSLSVYFVSREAANAADQVKNTSSSSSSSSSSSASVDPSRIVSQQLSNVITSSATIETLKLKPIEKITYTETKRFDAQLHTSLASKTYNKVTVDVSAPYKVDATPQRMAAWLRKIEKSGGTIGQCQEAPRSGAALAFILGLIKEFGPALLAELDKWYTYRPAKDWNALVYTSTEGNVKMVIFERRMGALDEQVCEEGFKSVEWDSSNISEK